MLFRYDFGKKLDLSKFSKQAAFYIGKIPSIEYHLMLPDFKVAAKIENVEKGTGHIVTIRVVEINRDKDGEVTGEYFIFPLQDTRFQDFKDIQSLFINPDSSETKFVSTSVIETTEKLYNLLKIVHKINQLKAFI